MPFIETKTNLPVPREKADAVKARFGKAIECIPGKTEKWLMVSVEPDLQLYFAGSDKPCAICTVSLYGHAGKAALQVLTGELTTILSEELSLDPSRVYVTYRETENWGWAGSNF